MKVFLWTFVGTVTGRGSTTSYPINPNKFWLNKYWNHYCHSYPKKVLATETYSFIECFDHDLYNTTISHCQLPQLSNGMLFPKQWKHWEGSAKPLIAPQKLHLKKKLTIPIHNVPAHKFHNSHPLNIRANHFFGEGGRVNSKNSHARNATYLEGINLSISDALSDPSLCSWS